MTTTSVAVLKTPPDYKTLAQEVEARCTDLMTDTQLDKVIISVLGQYYVVMSYPFTKAVSEVQGYLRMGRAVGAPVHIHVKEILDRRKNANQKKSSRPEPMFDGKQCASGEQAEYRSDLNRSL